MNKVRAADDPAAVVVMTAFGEVSTAVDAMRAGAADYLTKPLNFDELLVVLEKVFETQRLTRETRQLRQRVRDRAAPSNIIGAAPPMQRVFEVIDQVAPSKATVLITEDSGTGKELVANAIHQRSPRANGPFIKLHRAALAESLLESELFGHERGSFTGAMARKDGRFSLADGGTLFLDEIGEISPAIQVKLLRFLQDHEFERVGGTQTIRGDVRVIAATNRNLGDEIGKGRFREDLFYRLNVVSLETGLGAGGDAADPGRHDGRARALRDPRDPESDRRIDVARGSLICAPSSPPRFPRSPNGSTSAWPPIPARPHSCPARRTSSGFAKPSSSGWHQGSWAPTMIGSTTSVPASGASTSTSTVAFKFTFTSKSKSKSKSTN